MKQEKRELERKTALGYIRVSGLAQAKDGYGLETQEKEILKFCKENKINLLHKDEKDFFYRDIAKSGASEDEEDLLDKRDGIYELLLRVKKDKPDFVIVLNTSRLWRSDIPKIVIQRELKKQNTDVVSIEQPQYSIYNKEDPTNFLVFGMLELLDQYQRLEIRMKLLKGRRTKAQKGGFVGCRIAYGYEQDGKKDIQINPKTSKVVKEIFRLHTKKRPLGTHKIARYLNEKNIPVPASNGKRWHQKSVLRILNNKLYGGQYDFGEISNKRKDLKII